MGRGTIDESGIGRKARQHPPQGWAWTISPHRSRVAVFRVAHWSSSRYSSLSLSLSPGRLSLKFNFSRGKTVLFVVYLRWYLAPGLGSAAVQAELTKQVVWASGLCNLVTLKLPQDEVAPQESDIN